MEYFADSDSKEEASVKTIPVSEFSEQQLTDAVGCLAEFFP